MELTGTAVKRSVFDCVQFVICFLMVLWTLTQVMSVLRSNANSVMAMLEAFLYDPLVLLALF